MKAIATLVTCLAMTLPAHAQTILCIEDASTGLEWNGTAFVSMQPALKQRLLKRIELGDPVGFACFARMDKEGFSSAIETLDTLAYSEGCWAINEVGQADDKQLISQCREFRNVDGTIETVHCDRYGLIKYAFMPTGPFESTITYAGLTGRDGPAKPNEPMVMSVGKCSVIAP